MEASVWDGGSPSIKSLLKWFPLCYRYLVYLLFAHCFFPSLANLQFFDENHFSKNNVPARLEGDGKRGGAEPVWTCVVGLCAGGLSGSMGWEGCLRVSQKCW